MIFGIGTDIVAVERFQRFIDEGNSAILERIFTEHERSVCRARKKNCAVSFAARFAAKEAFLKALGTGLREGISWQDIEVVNDVQGKPELVITGKASDYVTSRHLSRSFLSLSHDGGYAAAVVVLEAS